MPDGTPLWRKGYDLVEAQVTPQLNTLYRSPRFATAMGLLTRAQTEVQREAERTTRRVLHAVNLPAASDMTRILREIGRLQSEQQRLDDRVRQLTERTGDEA